MSEPVLVAYRQAAFQAIQRAGNATGRCLGVPRRSSRLPRGDSDHARPWLPTVGRARVGRQLTLKKQFAFGVNAAKR
jgi:hypothetical protein